MLGDVTSRNSMLTLICSVGGLKVHKYSVELNSCRYLVNCHFILVVYCIDELIC